MTDIIEAIFGTIGETLNSFFTVLKNGIDSVVNIFYTPATETLDGSFTFLGTVLMIGLGIALVWTLIKWVSGLVRNVAR